MQNHKDSLIICFIESLIPCISLKNIRNQNIFISLYLIIYKYLYNITTKILSQQIFATTTQISRAYAIEIHIDNFDMYKYNIYKY